MQRFGEGSLWKFPPEGGQLRIRPFKHEGATHTHSRHHTKHGQTQCRTPRSEPDGGGWGKGRPAAGRNKHSKAHRGWGASCAPPGPIPHCATAKADRKPRGSRRSGLGLSCKPNDFLSVVTGNNSGSAPPRHPPPGLEEKRSQHRRRWVPPPGVGRPLPHRLHVPLLGQSAYTPERGEVTAKRDFCIYSLILWGASKQPSPLGMGARITRSRQHAAPGSPRPQFLLAGSAGANKEDFMSAAAPRFAACLRRSFPEPMDGAQPARLLRVPPTCRVPTAAPLQRAVPGTRTRRGADSKTQRYETTAGVLRGTQEPLLPQNGPALPAAAAPALRPQRSPAATEPGETFPRRTWVSTGCPRTTERPGL